MRWLILLAVILIAAVYVRGAYRELVRDPTMAWLTRRFKRAGRPGR